MSKPIDQFVDSGGATVLVGEEDGFNEVLCKLQIRYQEEELTAFLTHHAVNRLMAALTRYMDRL